jgi:hypothetical protein
MIVDMLIAKDYWQQVSLLAEHVQDITPCSR